VGFTPSLGGKAGKRVKQAGEFTNFSICCLLAPWAQALCSDLSCLLDMPLLPVPRGDGGQRGAGGSGSHLFSGAGTGPVPQRVHHLSRGTASLEENTVGQLPYAVGTTALSKGVRPVVPSAVRARAGDAVGKVGGKKRAAPGAGGWCRRTVQRQAGGGDGLGVRVSLRLACAL
jgi:hypothetical protein